MSSLFGHSPLKRFTLFLILLGLSFGVYAKTMNNPFIAWDDNIHIFENPNLNPPEVSKLAHFWTEPYKSLYIPVTYTSWGLLANLAYQPEAKTPELQFRTAPFHVLNIVFHALNAFLLFYLIYFILNLALLKQSSPVSDEKYWFASFLGAILFLLHPIQVESVAWITGFKDLLSVFFSFLSLRQFLLYLSVKKSSEHLDKKSKEKEWRAKLKTFIESQTTKTALFHYAVASLAFLAALLSKPSAVSVLPILLLFGPWLFRAKWSDELLALIPWGVASLVAVGITQGEQSQNIYSITPIFERPLVAFDAVSFYLSKLFAPFTLCADYGRNPRYLFDHPNLLFLDLVGLALVVLLWRVRKKADYLFFSSLIFVAALVPNLGLVPFVFQNFSTVADRYAYLACFGAALAFSFISLQLNSKKFNYALLALCVCLGGRSFLQTDYWKNSEVFLMHNLEVNDHSWMSYQNLGHYLQLKGENERALPYFLKGIELNPNDVQIEYNYSSALIALKRFSEVIDRYTKILARSPERWGLHHQIAVAYSGLGDNASAIQHYLKALEGNPNSIDSRFNLALLYETSGRVAEARAQFEMILKVAPAYPRAKEHLDAISSH